MSKPKLSEKAIQRITKPGRPGIEPRRLYRWEGVFENWSKNWVRAQGWRVLHVWGSQEDALQQCAMTWAKCVDRYAETADGPAHMMALYKTALTNHWHKFAVKDGQYRELISEATEDDHYDWLGQGAYVRSEGPLAAALAGASKELRYVLGMIMDAPSEVLTLLLPNDGETPDLGKMDRSFRRWFGLPREAAVVTELKNLLQP